MMLVLNMLRFRSLLTIALLVGATATSSCAQEKPKRMIPGPSEKELIPSSPNAKEDGITQITIGLLFKPGATEYTRIGASGVKDSPPLPTGFVLFKDLVFRLKTEAIISGYQVTVFSLPSVADERVFGKIEILHLENDEMSPSGFSWNPVAVVRGGWDEQYHFVPKDQYDSLVPDFSSKRITAITHELGVFAVAISPEPEAKPASPFTQFEVVPSSAPVPVAVGEEVTHTILVKNKGPGAASEVDFQAEMDADFGYKVQSSQGSCHQSDQSSGRLLCYLGAMPAGSTATITIVGRVSRHLGLPEGISELGNMLEVVFKARPTDFVDGDSQLLLRFDFKILKQP